MVDECSMRYAYPYMTCNVYMSAVRITQYAYMTYDMHDAWLDNDNGCQMSDDER